MDSQERLLILCKDGHGQITKCSRKVETMTNGIEYYFIEVTRNDGNQYGIQAYGEEAFALHEETRRIIQQNFWESLIPTNSENSK
jgi:hypothetical protein